MERKDISAIVFEGFGIVKSGMSSILDRVILIDTPDEERIRRILADSHRKEMTRDHVLRIMASQQRLMDQARSIAQWTIDNSVGTEALAKRVDQILHDLLLPPSMV